MISIEKCRELLGDNNYTDVEILNIRDSIYSLAELAIDDHIENSYQKINNNH